MQPCTFSNEMLGSPYDSCTRQKKQKKDSFRETQKDVPGDVFREGGCKKTNNQHTKNKETPTHNNNVLRDMFWGGRGVISSVNSIFFSLLWGVLLVCECETLSSANTELGPFVSNSHIRQSDFIYLDYRPLQSQIWGTKIDLT